MPTPLRLGVNIDHVATLRNARGGRHPDPVRAARLVAAAGAEQITLHLREDRRHIRDEDARTLCVEPILPVNLEMAATEEMVAIATELRPAAVCLVPERRQEVTTEGGLDAAGQGATLGPVIARLQAAGIRPALFIDPDPAQLEAARQLQVPVVELHTGAYCDAKEARTGERELARLRAAAAQGAALGLAVHAGHGIDFDTVGPIAAIPQIIELNIGHFLVGEALFTGLEAAIRRMRALMDQARSAAA